MISSQDVALLESSFKKYYFDHLDLIREPDRIREREFGYQRFNSGMIRHIQLKGTGELRLFLMNNVPSDVYCSNGYYLSPNLAMSDKDWKEADLIFDIDAKDLNLDCRAGHLCSRCEQCGSAFAHATVCPSCNSNRVVSRSLSCMDCIRGAKAEVKKLSEILTSDLGIVPDDILVYFSGNEGFHVHVSGSDYNSLGSRERSELVDYVTVRNIMPDRLGMSKYGSSKYEFPQLGESGMRGRIAKAVFGSKSRRSKAIPEIKKGGYGYFQNMLLECAPKIGAAVDPSVTMDVHRIFRMPGTLNSKSGLAKTLCEDLERFDPYKDACLIDDSETEVTANCPICFSLKGRKFGPYDNERVQMPKFAAVYLICKGFATTA